MSHLEAYSCMSNPRYSTPTGSGVGRSKTRDEIAGTQELGQRLVSILGLAWGNQAIIREIEGTISVYSRIDWNMRIVV